MNANSQSFSQQCFRISRDMRRRIRQADAERNRRNHGATGHPTNSTVAHARKKQSIRRKAGDTVMGPLFGGIQPRAFQPIPQRLRAPQLAARRTVETVTPAHDEFIPFGPGDEYDYEPTEPRVTRPIEDVTKDEITYRRWNELLPQFIEPMLAYTSAATGTGMSATRGTPDGKYSINPPIDGCGGESCTQGARVKNIVLVYLRHLARNGANSTESIAATLHDQHRANGYILRNSRGEPVQEGFRKHLAPALTWFDLLRNRIEAQTRDRIAAARVQVLYSSTDEGTPVAKPATSAVALDAPAVSSAAPAVSPRSSRIPFPTVEDVMDEDTDPPRAPPSAVDMDIDTEPAPRPQTAKYPWHPDPPSQTAGAGAGGARGGFTIPPEILAKVRSITGPARLWIDVALRYGLSPEGRKSVSQYLVRRCPECYTCKKVQVPVSEGCTVQVATDGNFGQRHNIKPGTCPVIDHESEAFVPVDFVNAVGAALEEARQRPARRNRSKAPEAAVKQCEKSHTAANGSRVKASTGIHDDFGLEILNCRHDIPIFACNIDTPGEQQKYSVALLIWLLLHLPDETTVLNLYDIGCVVDKTLTSYEVLTPEMESRVLFATSAMHAYAHQWECQLVYSPRMIKGVGLTDGEGVERLWSRLRKLISILRGVHRQRRIIILDRHMSWLAERMRDDLGKWLKRKWKALLRRETVARSTLQLHPHDPEYLRSQWAQQRETQLGVRRMTVPRLKKELEAVMALQDQIQNVEEAICVAETALADAPRPDGAEARTQLDKLRDTHKDLTTQADALYSSLNVEQAFPDIQDFGIDFARALIMAYDAKCIARHKLIGRFFEWDYLDQASGGKAEPLGTRQHQKVVQAIQRRAPAIVNAITRYNNCCARVRNLLPPGESFPLPEALPTDLTELKKDPTLLQDVWVARLPEGAPDWLTDNTVRQAIRAQLSLDRCVEERRRLRQEEENLFDWMVLEAKSVAHALQDPANALFVPQLRRELAQLEDLATGCKNLSIPNKKWLEAAQVVIPTPSEAPPTVAPPAPAVPSNPPTIVPTAPELPVNRQLWTAPRVGAPVSAAGMLTPPTTPQHVRVMQPPTPASSPVRYSDSDNEDSSAEDVEDPFLSAPRDVLMVEVNSPPVDFKPFKHFPVRQIDMKLPLDVATFVPVEVPLRPPPLSRPASNGFSAITCTSVDLHHFTRGWAPPHRVIYAAAAALVAEYAEHPENLLVVSPYLYPSWLDNRGVRHAHMFAELERTEFWNKNVILFPIYTDPHWVLAVAYPGHCKIDFFDSMGLPSLWKKHVPIVAELLTEMSKIATAKGVQGKWPTPQAWSSSAHVQFAEPKQKTTGLDGSLWVLAAVAAVASSFRTTGLVHEDIPRFRAYMYSLLCKHFSVPSRA